MRNIFSVHFFHFFASQSGTKASKRRGYTNRQSKKRGGLEKKDKMTERRGRGGVEVRQYLKVSKEVKVWIWAVHDAVLFVAFGVAIKVAGVAITTDGRHIRRSLLPRE